MYPHITQATPPFPHPQPPHSNTMGLLDDKSRLLQVTWYTCMATSIAVRFFLAWQYGGEGYQTIGNGSKTVLVILDKGRSLVPSVESWKDEQRRQGRQAVSIPPFIHTYLERRRVSTLPPRLCQSIY